MMKKILQLILKWLSIRTLKKYKPMIIGITGSVGKSSTKEAIYSVLSSEFRVRRSLKNYNNEIGVPLTILGHHSPGKDFFGWLRVFWMSVGNLIFKSKNYPKILILEMAADHPGDIKYLTSFAKPDIAVLTAIAPVHLEFFGNLNNVIKEKSILVKSLSKNGWAVLNGDDRNILSLKDKIDAKILTFGIKDGVDVQAIEIHLEQNLLPSGRPQIQGLNFKVKYRGSIVPCFLPKIIGLPQIYAVLSAICVGLILELNLIEIIEALREYKPPKGRMNLIEGINNSLIIDDTYNSSPFAVLTALEELTKINIASFAKRWVILGDMLELGKESESLHRQIGEKIAGLNIDYLITFGQMAKYIAQSAIDNKMSSEKVYKFIDQKELINFVKKNINSGDVILIKGSQGMRMEKIVKELMAQPGLAKKLLVRQEKEWQIK